MRQVTEKHKRRNLTGGKLCDIFDLNIFSFPCRGWIVLDDRQHRFVQLGSRNTALTVFIHIFGCFQYLQDALFRQRRDKQDRKVGKRSQTFADRIHKGIDHLLAFIFHQIPFVHTNDQAFLVLLNQREDVQILAFNAAGGIQHQHADIRILDSADRTDHGIIFQILVHLSLLTNTGCIHQIEIQAEFIIFRINRITGRTGNIRYNMAIFTDKGVDQRRFTSIRTADDGDTGQFFFEYLRLVIRKSSNDFIQQIARTRTVDGRDTERIT